MENLIPTDGELKTFFEKIVAFINEFIDLFTALADGFKLTFAGYKSIYDEK